MGLAQLYSQQLSTYWLSTELSATSTALYTTNLQFSTVDGVEKGGSQGEGGATTHEQCQQRVRRYW